jgi:hypothetical protein
MSPQKLTTGFVYGRPVRGKEFINRTNELRTVFSRIGVGDSTAIVGEPHIGKTSLLLRLSEKEILREYFGDNSENFVFNFIDLHSIPATYKVNDFWSDTLQPFTEHPGNSSISHRIQRVKESDFSRSALEGFFKGLSNANRVLVLLLDEFERLIMHPNFQDPSFYALLRGLSTHVGGLVLILASRMSLEDLNSRGHDLLPTGSPLFNNMIEVRLKSFDDVALQEFFEHCSDAGFINEDVLFIRRIAGRKPFLIQGMSAALCEARQNKDRHAIAAEAFYESISFHFSDLWSVWDNTTRTAATILSLLEFGGRALGKSFNYAEIENVEKFGPELRKLSDQGLAEKIGNKWEFDSEHLLVWRGERWTVSSQAFAWWIRDSVVVGCRDIPEVQIWLHDQTYKGLVTQKQWDVLMNKVNKAPKWAIQGVGTLARVLFMELTKRT